MIWSLLSWLSQHPAQVLGLLIFLFAGTWIISAAVGALMLASENRKDAEQRKRFQALGDMTTHGKPRAAGLHSRRIS